MESPLGIIGKAFDMLVLKAYMRKFLSRRCEALRQCLESNERRRYLQ
jgi:hypothetical protein